MLTIKDVSVVPSQGWRYPRVDGTPLVVRNYSIFYDEIVKHYTANGQPPPTREEVTRYVCENLPIPCYEGREPLINKFTAGIFKEKSKPCGTPCGS